MSGIGRAVTRKSVNMLITLAEKTMSPSLRHLWGYSGLTSQYALIGLEGVSRSKHVIKSRTHEHWKILKRVKSKQESPTKTIAPMNAQLKSMKLPLPAPSNRRQNHSSEIFVNEDESENII